MYCCRSRERWSWRISVWPVSSQTHRSSETHLWAHPSGWHQRSSNSPHMTQRWASLMMTEVWASSSYSVDISKRITLQKGKLYLHFLLLTGWYLVAGHHSDWAGERRAPPLWSASYEGAVSHSKEQPPHAGGQLLQTSERVCRSLFKQRAQFCEYAHQKFPEFLFSGALILLFTMAVFYNLVSCLPRAAFVDIKDLLHT